MADKEKRSLREFLRHINDYTYRFNPEKGQFRYRELRGVRDTAFDFYMWLKCWKDMVAFVAKCPVSAVRALFRYQWFATYLTYPNFVDRGTLGMRGNQLRMARAQYDRIVKKATDLLRISFVADEHFHPGNKLSKKVVLFDELVPGEIMACFPNLIYLPAQVLPVFLCSILDQQITPPYLDAAENFGIPADVCPLPSAEAGCALRDEYPKVGTCFVACNMPCDGSVATTSYQDRYFNLPTYYFGVPIRYNEEAVQDYAVEELRGLIRFIEEQTGETFDWDAFFRAMKVYNQETEYELQKWEVNRTPYPQMTGETFWIYRMFFYHLSGGMDPHFLDTDRRVNRIMMRGYQQKKPCAPAMRHRCVEWSCPANFYPDFSVWAENCWGINVVASMESLISDIIINTEDPDQALADLARSYQRTTMRKHTKGGYANVVVPGELLPRLLCLGGKLLGHQRRGEHGVAHFRHHHQHGRSRSGARRPRPQLPAHHHAQAHEGRLRERGRRAVDRLQTVQRRHGAHVRPDLLQGHGRSARRVRGAGGRARRAYALGGAGSARFAHDLQA